TSQAIWDAVNLPPGPTTNYVIIRQPRPIPGEAPLQLPDDVAIDYQLSVPNIPSAAQSALTNSYYDILFTPSGPLTGPLGDSNGKIILWVRDITQDPDQPGEQPLIVVFSKTGRIGGFPVNPDQTKFPAGYPNLYPYYFVLDPRASGL